MNKSLCVALCRLNEQGENMKKEYKKILESISYAVSVLLITWLILSMIEVNTHNLESGYQYNKLNVFVLLTKEVEVEVKEKIQVEAAQKTQQKEIEKEIKKEMKEEDIECLARVINGEAGADYCSDALMTYVGSVVLNRVKSKDFPNTLEEVIFQEGQYACTFDKNKNYFKEPSERAWKIAKDLLTNGSALPEDVVYQAEFKQGSRTYIVEQNMYFCSK